MIPRQWGEPAARGLVIGAGLIRILNPVYFVKGSGGARRRISVEAEERCVYLFSFLRSFELSAGPNPAPSRTQSLGNTPGLFSDRKSVV